MMLLKRFTLYLTISSLFVAGLIPVINTSQAQAVTASDWQAGRIIDDAVFTNKDSMNADQIQSFLNAKVPVCDTMGTKPISAGSSQTRAQWAAANGKPAPPYTCLRDFYEVPKTEPSPGKPANNYGGKPIPAGARSAAQLIWDAGQAYSISPKVLLTTIQKESNGPLTTDDWPYEWFYTYAMGAHCPDSGPGGSANCDSNYAGFSIQMRESARLFRYYLDNMYQPWWPYKKPGNNFILWNVQGTGCGGSDVVIQTMATAALYTYTPYQPNQAALKNMYSTGDGCSAYGNRNFWRIYNDWFGNSAYSYAANSRYAKSPCNIPYFDVNSVGRLYNSEIKDYLYTTSWQEACTVIAYGYIWDGAVFVNIPPAQGSVPVYRLADHIRHVFTTDAQVKQDYINNKGYHEEGIAFYAHPSSKAGTQPVYCLTDGLSVFYTSAGGEKTYFEQFYKYTNVGIAFYAQSVSERVELARLNRNNLDRLYTTSAAEKQSSQSYGFTPETSHIVSDTAPTPESTPVYRLLSTHDGKHFYTRDRHERDLAVIYYNFYSEGIGFYSPISTIPNTKPVHRLTNYNNLTRLYTASAVEKDMANSQYGYNYENIGWYSY